MAADGRLDIRRLGPDDLPGMRAMLDMLGVAFEEPHTFRDAPPDDAYLGRLLGRDHFVALAAFDGETAVGGLCAYVLDKFEQARAEVYIYDLAVDERYRRRGTATALIEALKPIARASGAWAIFVQADPPDAPAVALYTKLGVRADVLHFDMVL